MLSELRFDLDMLWADFVHVGIAFAIAFPIGWERGRGRHSVGFRTLPIVAMASCGLALTVQSFAGVSPEANARVLQGIITGIGFVGGGAILKHGTSVRGLVTAASIWNAGAIGAAVGFGRINIAIVLSALNLMTLWVLTPLAHEDEE